MLGIFYELAACPSGTSSDRCCRCTPLLESDRQESKFRQRGVNLNLGHYKTNDWVDVNKSPRQDNTLMQIKPFAEVQFLIS
jgi:hypothetical protein